MRDLIRKLALQNAVKYGGKANPGTVIGKFFSQHPEKRNSDTIKEINDIVTEVNSMSKDKQAKELESLGGPEEIKRKKQEFKLPDLPNVKDKVILRFAPNPNGPMHFGHARQAIVNWFFKEKYDGEYILRFDDTDPRTKVPMKEAYDWFKEDLKWLGIKADNTYMQSKRLKIYQKYAEELFKQGNAYVCRCDTEEKRELLKNSEPCPCREEPVETQLEEWKNFLNKYKEGTAVVRIKTELDNPNPAIRDWPAFRIIDKPKHPLVKGERIWPLLNFASAVDDIEMDITHKIHGVDMKVSGERQEYIFKFFKKPVPEVLYTGKLYFKGVKSTSEASEMIKNKELTGWDDIRLGTLMALRRRGILPETIVNFMKDAGLKKGEINVSIEKLATFNRQILDESANRYFFIKDPIKIKIKNAPDLKTKVPLHPDFPKRGSTTFETKDQFYINDHLKSGRNYRLMHLLNFKNEEFVSKDHDPSLKAQLIHWLPVSKDNVKVEVLMPDGSVAKGLGEPALKKLKEGSMVQFFRFGFCRLDKKSDSKLQFWMAHD